MFEALWAVSIRLLHHSELVGLRACADMNCVGWSAVLLRKSRIGSS